jgi:hypothetical protein
MIELLLLFLEVGALAVIALAAVLMAVAVWQIHGAIEQMVPPRIDRIEVPVEILERGIGGGTGTLNT